MPMSVNGRRSNTCIVSQFASTAAPKIPTVEAITAPKEAARIAGMSISPTKTVATKKATRTIVPKRASDAIGEDDEPGRKSWTGRPNLFLHASKYTLKGCLCRTGRVPHNPFHGTWYCTNLNWTHLSGAHVRWDKHARAPNRNQTTLCGSHTTHLERPQWQRAPARRQSGRYLTFRRVPVLRNPSSRRYDRSHSLRRWRAHRRRALLPAPRNWSLHRRRVHRRLPLVQQALPPSASARSARIGAARNRAPSGRRLGSHPLIPRPATSKG